MMAMDEPARKWTIKFANRQFWRVANLMDLDDLIAEGSYVWCRIQTRKVLQTHREVMAIYRIAFANHIHDLSVRATRERSMLEVVGDVNSLNSASDHNPGPLLRLLDSLPDDLRLYLGVLATDLGARLLRQPYRVRHGGRRETTQERLQRLVGRDVSPDRIRRLLSRLEFTLKRSS